jgi:hypothetical protein
MTIEYEPAQMYAQCGLAAAVAAQLHGMQVAYPDFIDLVASFTFIPLMEYSLEALFTTNWDIEYTNHFGAWRGKLNEAEQGIGRRICSIARELRAEASASAFKCDQKITVWPHARAADTARGAPIPRALCLRPAPLGHPPVRRGQDKDRWYEESIPRADALYDEHLAQLEKDRIDNGEEIF